MLLLFFFFSVYARIWFLWCECGKEERMFFYWNANKLDSFTCFFFFSHLFGFWMAMHCDSRGICYKNTVWEQNHVDKNDKFKLSRHLIVTNDVYWVISAIIIKNTQQQRLFQFNQEKVQHQAMRKKTNRAYHVFFALLSFLTWHQMVKINHKNKQP